MLRDISVFALLMISAWCWAEEEPIVHVEQGDLRGKVVNTDEGTKYYSFQGIPYAKPPLGKLRFKDAQEPEAWEGTRDATQTGCKCTQVDTQTSDYTGCEDCLFLNVYTPQLPNESSNQLPVMVWIHGGGFISGSGDDDVYGPKFLVSENVILITLNYRLGCLGFIFLEEAAPGNVGLKDQVAAFRWVKQNVAAFNGDPEKVTLFGDSAGAVSIHFHMLSPMTEGLFQGVIAESGAIMNSWDIQCKPYETSLRLARAVGCTAEDDDEIVECLRGIDHIELFKASITEAPTQRDQDRLLNFPFTPTVEEYSVWGVETYLTGTPEQLIKDGCQHDVPYMTGFNNAEWTITFAMNMTVLETNENLQVLDSDWKRYVCPETRLPEGSCNDPEPEEELRKFFLDGEPLTTENVQGYKDMFTDLQTAEGTYYNVKYIAESRKSDVYLYSFTVEQALNYLKPKFNVHFSGASHNDEIGYLFETNSLPDVTPDDPAFLTRQIMVRLWTNFAKYGNPTPTDDPLIGKNWKAYTCSERNYLAIGNDITTGRGLNKDRVQFWEDFYKKFGAKREGSGLRWRKCSCSIFSSLSCLIPFTT